MKRRQGKKQKASQSGQHKMFAKGSSAYGGALRRRRKGRGARPLSIKQSMHLVLRSTRAKNELSFRTRQNEKTVSSILKKFSKKHSVLILSFANVGNHLHLHIQLGSRQTYKAFIRAVTGAIAQTVTRASRLRKLKTKFWDERPFTRIIQGLKAAEIIESYISLNRYEASGYSRAQAKVFVALDSA